MSCEQNQRTGIDGFDACFGGQLEQLRILSAGIENNSSWSFL
jgi:hypothetical protein